MTNARSKIENKIRQKMCSSVSTQNKS